MTSYFYMKSSRRRGSVIRCARCEARWIPLYVIERAQEILCILEQGEQSKDLARLADDLPLFSPRRRKKMLMLKTSKLEKVLAITNEIGQDALEILYKLKAIVRPIERHNKFKCIFSQWECADH